MARPRGQRGQVKRHGNNWIFVYYDLNGERTHEILAPYALHPFRDDEKGREQVREKFIDKINGLLRTANADVPTVAMMDSLLTVEQYINQVYWKRCEERRQLQGANHMEPSTIHGYRNIFDKHVTGKPIASVPLNRLTTKDCQDWLDSVPQNLSHQTHLRVRAFLSGVLTAALQGNVISGVNPMDATKAGGLSKGRKESDLSEREKSIRASHNHAYHHAEIADMLETLPDPARTISAVAAFTGLTKSEIPALKREDYKKGEIFVSRKKWRQHIGAPKTEAREAAVPVAPLLREILEKYLKKTPPVEGGWMFYGSKEKKPIDMDNLARRDITPFINGTWRGWHAFRRGLGTRLADMGMRMENVQRILRHANISTTAGFYVFPSDAKMKTGLKRLTETVRKKYGIKA